MHVPHRLAVRRLLIVALIVLLVNAGFLLIARAQAGPGAPFLNNLRLFLLLVRRDAAPPLNPVLYIAIAIHSEDRYNPPTLDYYRGHLELVELLN